MIIFDSYYWLLVVPALLISMWAQVRVQSAFRKYGRIPTRSGWTGAYTCQFLQQRAGLNVPIQSVAGNATDHYDPRANVIRLSQTVGPVDSVMAVGVAAHETGHAMQYAAGYFPVKIRSVILPTTQIASTAAPYLFILGLIFSLPTLAYVGLAFYFMAVLFQILTLPVEFNASARAMRALRDSGSFTEEELRGVRRVLTAAAMTYVAAMLVSLMSFLRLLLIVSRRNDRR